MFGFGKRKTKVPERSVPADTVVWALGDIHGRYDLLEALAGWIVHDLERSSADRKVLIFLGDYIDRGPQSREVLDLLRELAAMPAIETHFLRGNHEEQLEAVLTDAQMAPAWCDYGGAETMRSYGVTPPVQRHDAEGWIAAVQALNTNMPDDHRSFLAEQKMSLTIGDYFFAHAGARPGVPLDKQSAHDLMWVRQEFLSHSKIFDRLIVHGHTPSQSVHSDHRRIGIDTGAYATGVLTGLRLEGINRRVAQTSVTEGSILIAEEWV